MRDNYPGEPCQLQPSDNGTITNAGFRIEKDAYICGNPACRKLARKGCCPLHSAANRTRMIVIHKMRLETKVIESTSQFY